MDDLDRFVVTIPIAAPKGSDPSEIAAVMNRMIAIGLEDAQDTVDDEELDLDDQDQAHLAISLFIGQPEVSEAKYGEGGPEDVGGKEKRR